MGVLEDRFPVCHMEMAGRCWCDEETLKLIEIWGEDSTQAQLEGCKRNKNIFDRMRQDKKELSRKNKKP